MESVEEKDVQKSCNQGKINVRVCLCWFTADAVKLLNDLIVLIDGATIRDVLRLVKLHN